MNVCSILTLAILLQLIGSTLHWFLDLLLVWVIFVRVPGLSNVRKSFGGVFEASTLRVVKVPCSWLFDQVTQILRKMPNVKVGV